MWILFWSFVSLEYDLLNSLTVSLLLKNEITWILVIVETIWIKETLESLQWLRRCGIKSIKGAYYLASMGKPLKVKLLDKVWWRSTMFSTEDPSLLFSKSSTRSELSLFCWIYSLKCMSTSFYPWYLLLTTFISQLAQSLTAAIRSTSRSILSVNLSWFIGSSYWEFTTGIEQLFPDREVP